MNYHYPSLANPLRLMKQTYAFMLFYTLDKGINTNLTLYLLICNIGNKLSTLPTSSFGRLTTSAYTYQMK